jgi:hypothetical protein
VRLAVHQPNYIPWCGYFSKIRACDVFVFLDDAEISTGQSYVYRSQVRGPNGAEWLSVPTHRSLHQSIRDVTFADAKWARKHLHKLDALYAKAPHFREVFPLLEPIFREPGELLADFNIRLIRAIAAYLGLERRFERSSELKVEGKRDDRHIALAAAVGADRYLSGKGGQGYQDPARFAEAGLRLEVSEYTPVAYSQIHGEFLPGLSIVDALFNCGRGAAELLAASPGDASPEATMTNERTA